MFGFWRKKPKYTCSCCGKTFEGAPSMAFKRPCYYFDVPEADRDARITIDDDMCHIRADPNVPGDEDIFAIRCILDIPIRGVSEPFSWGVWVSQSRASFERYLATYNDDQSGDSSFGWLAVEMAHYRRTAPGERLESLACDVQWGKKGSRPKIILEPCDHRLYRDQTHGIAWKTALEIAGPHTST